jgi:phosphoribosylaminoimidazole-succinocarboxamide synthase
VPAATPLLETRLNGLAPHRQGKVRDIFDLGDSLLMVATDRISAFDCVLGSGIPDKGRVLTQLSAFWFAQTTEIVPNHLVTTDVSAYPLEMRRHADVLAGRSMLVKKTSPVPIECVARGYLAGSGWKEYVANGSVCGVPLPRGLRESDRLPEPIFTPATKATSGHDINVSEAEAGRHVGAALVARLRQLTLALYNFGAAHAESRGIILADTKFEFGLTDTGDVILIDEMMTPDSSRYWPRDQYQPGGPQPSFDKQYVRDYLEEIRWNKQPPVPSLPEQVVLRTRDKYIEAFRRLTGKELA